MAERVERRRTTKDLQIARVCNLETLRRAAPAQSDRFVPGPVPFGSYPVEAAPNMYGCLREEPRPTIDTSPFRATTDLDARGLTRSMGAHT
jgi:hypothetical protein